MVNYWREHAEVVEEVYGGHVDWGERFYICPECGEPVYEEDWENGELEDFMCPICAWAD